MSRPLRLAAAAFALAAVGLPAAARAEPPPPRPVCQLHTRDRTISNDLGLPDVTYPDPYWVC